MNALSRRTFGRLVGTGVLAAALPPIRLHAAPASVRLSANENPYGPSASALDAMRDSMRLAWRYPDEAADALVETIARLHNVSADQIILGDGSSEILKLAAAAFSSPSRKVVMADPTFEAIGAYGRAAGAEAVRVPLDPSYGHDLTKMAAVPSAGLIYVCNPNNPTASITPKEPVQKFLDSVPVRTVVLVDEAYFHYADDPRYESVVAQVQTHPNLIVARTFSKIYGMAGVRCGYGIAQKSVIEQLERQKAWDSMNIGALAGARASLLDPQHVVEGRRRNSETRRRVVSEIKRLGFEVIPSQANFIMIDIKHNVRPLIAAMRDQGVRVGRLFPAMPNHLRVTIGRPEEMERFVEVFRTVS